MTESVTRSFLQTMRFLYDFLVVTLPDILTTLGTPFMELINDVPFLYDLWDLFSTLAPDHVVNYVSIMLSGQSPISLLVGGALGFVLVGGIVKWILNLVTFGIFG